MLKSVGNKIGSHCKSAYKGVMCFLPNYFGQQHYALTGVFEEL